MGKGGMGAHFAFSGDPEALLELDGKEAIGALHELAPVVTKTMQVYSEVIFKLIQASDKAFDKLILDQESSKNETNNLDAKLQTFQGEYDGNLKAQEEVNNEWDKRMRKVEAVISGLPAWKDETVNLIIANKRSDDQRYAEHLSRLQDLENDHAVVKEDLFARMAAVEDKTEKHAQAQQAADRRILALEEDMKKQILDLAKLHESMNSRYQGVEEQMGAIKLSLSRFNHEYKLLEAAHEDLKNQEAADIYRLNEALSVAAQEHAVLGQDVLIVKSAMEDANDKLNNRVDALIPQLKDLEEMKNDLSGMRTELEQSVNNMDEAVPAPPPTTEPTELAGQPTTPPLAKGKKLKMIARLAVASASKKSLGDKGNTHKGGAAGGLTYMMNYLKERIEGITAHSIEQDNEIGDLQTRTGEIVLDLMRLRKTEDDMVTVKTTIREYRDLIERNKNDLAQSIARQEEEDQQMYAMIEKKAYETMKSVGMDVKGARAELKSLCDTNLNAIRELRSTVNSLAGKPQEDKQDKGKQTTVAVEEQMKAIADAAKNVAEMQGRMVVVEGHIESHEQRLTDQGAQIYDISAKVLTELDKELNGIRDDIQEKTSMLHREVLLRPTEPDVKEIFSAMKMGLMGETASHELKQMMERLLQASKRHLRYERPVSGQRQKKFGSGSNAEEMIPGTPDNRRVDHIKRLENPGEDSTSGLITSFQERLDQLIDRPHSCVDSLVLYTYLLTARLDEMGAHHSQVLKKVAAAQKEASQSFGEISKLEAQVLGQPQESKQIKRLENAIRELARITIAQDRDTVMLGSISRDQRGEFYRCLSCDNHPIPMEDLQRGPLDVLPSLAAATPQAYMGRDKVLHPDRIRTAAASPERITSRGRVYSSSSVAPAAQAQAASSPVAWQQEGAGESESSGSPPRAAVYSNLPTVLSTSQQMAHGLSMRMESFAPYSDMPPPQFHGRGAAMRRDQQNGLTRSSELPSISSPKPRTANGSPLRGTAQPAQQP